MKKVLVIALDAAEASLIETWTNDGSMPALKSLIDRGGYGRLDSPAEWLTGASWPTFYTGTNPAVHGFYNYLVWNAETMRTEAPTSERLPLHPFWRRLKDPNGPCVIAVDIPLTYDPEPFNGKELSGFGTHDVLTEATGYPQAFVNEIRSQYGSQWMVDEKQGMESTKEYFHIRDEMIAVTKRAGDLCMEMIQSESWDLFLACFAAAHRAGHRLRGLHNIKDTPSESAREELSDALRQVYMACDTEIGRLVEAAGPQATTLVFALHGMQDNTSLVPVLPEMLRRILQNESPSATTPPPGLLSRIRALIPIDIRHRVKQALPIGLRHRLTAFWRRNTNDWNKTPAFSMMSDAQGWIRINLKGRERFGIVNPGKEYDDLCEKIANGLYTYKDEGTGRPLVRNVLRASQVFEGVNIDKLPDLIVLWEDVPVHTIKTLHSERYGSIGWPTPGHNPDGRSGNHLKSGNITNGHTLDLAPTILALLDQPIPGEMEGKVLSIIQQ